MKAKILSLSCLIVFFSCTSDDSESSNDVTTQVPVIDVTSYTIQSVDENGNEGDLQTYTLNDNKFSNYNASYNTVSGDFTYDNDGLLEKYEQYNNTVSFSKTLYDYNSNGNLIEILRQDENGNDVEQIIFNHTSDTVFVEQYIAQGGIGLSQISTYKIVFDALDNRTYLQRDNGQGDVKQVFVSIQNNNVSVKSSINSDQISSISLSYTHDASAVNTLNYIYKNMFGNKRNVYLAGLRFDITDQANDFRYFRFDEGVMQTANIDSGVFSTGIDFTINSTINSDDYLEEISFKTLSDGNYFSEILHRFSFN